MFNSEGTGFKIQNELLDKFELSPCGQVPSVFILYVTVC